MSEIPGAFSGSATRLALAALATTPLDGITKGYPAYLPPTTLGQVGELGLSVLRDELPYPLAVLRRSALQHNCAWMEEFLAHTGVSLAPHAKTSMSPQLFAMQAESGSWGLTVATVQQAIVAAQSGCRRILMANQMVSRADVRGAVSLLRRFPDVALWSYVDSAAGAHRLAGLVTESGAAAPLRVLLEVGMDGGRTGCRTEKQALETSAAIAERSAQLQLAGIACFEGLIRSADRASDESRVSAFLDFLAGTAETLDRRSAFAEDEMILTAGGSIYFDMVARRLAALRLSRPARVVIRSGCYLTHDSKFYEETFDRIQDRIPESWRRMGRLRPALFVWSMVQSRPESGLAILTMGKRDASFDIDLPQPALHFRPGRMATPLPVPAAWKVRAMNDQHAYLAVGESDDVQVGDLVACGISHPCTTFDRWRMLYIVDDDWSVVAAVVTSF